MSISLKLKVVNIFKKVGVYIIFFSFFAILNAYSLPPFLDYLKKNTRYYVMQEFKVENIQQKMFT